MIRLLAIPLTGLIGMGFGFASAQERFSESWNGGTFAYPDGKPEITAQTITLDGSTDVPFHCHPVPTMAHVLQGELEVETRAGKKRVFRQGDSLVEVMGTVHRGSVVTAPVELVVFYAGAAGLPVTVLAEDDASAQFCKN